MNISGYYLYRGYGSSWLNPINRMYHRPISAKQQQQLTADRGILKTTIEINEKNEANTKRECK